GFTPIDDDAKGEEEAGNSVNQFACFGNSLNNEGSRVQSRVNRSFSLKSRGPIMDVIENLVDIGQTMGDNATISDSFVAVRGTWIPSSTKLMIVSVYAPQDLSEKKYLWEYISHIIDSWDGECIILGDFNKVRSEHERFGTIFNEFGANAFNHFISTASLIDLPLEGYSYTWAIKSASKMSKLDSKIIILKKKLQALKTSIKSWCKEDTQRSNESRFSTQARISDLNKLFDRGHSNEELVKERTSLLKELHDINKCHSLDMAQKAKVRWAIEGDQNSKFFHGIINKKSISKKLSAEQIVDLKCDVTYDEIKRAVWDCGTNKSPDLNGFTFDFIRTFWKIINQDVVNAVREFFIASKCPPGCNSSFIALIPKKQDAKFVKDFRSISLIGCFYKIIAKILANRLNMVISDLISDVQSAFAFDSVRWDYLDGILSNFGFGPKWRRWIQGCLSSAMGSILVNGLFKGIRIDDTLTLSHIFYADDAIFIGKWERANVITIVRMLNCFFMASGLQINIHKRKLMGIGVSIEEVNAAANIIGCSTFSTPFTYLGFKVGMSSSRKKSWDEVIGKISAHLSKWKIKTLSIGGRHTLIKSVLTSLPLYHMSLYKAPLGVLHDLESFRIKVFNGIDENERKISMIGSVSRSSPWNCIIKELGSLSSKDTWINDTPLSITFPQLYALENRKRITVAEKISEDSLFASFQRAPCGGAEEDQFIQLVDLVDSITIYNSNDRWVWLLDSSG
nr:RNA-directed DNA polymerase, eukaryota [Tanacetum cinerariifolium]